jgi:cyclase
MTIFGRLIFAATLGAVAFGAGAADNKSLKFQFPDWQTVPIEDHDLGGGVHMLESFGGNIGVYAWSGGIFMVDAEYPQLSDRIKQIIAKISSQPIRYLVDTHYHWDHLGANTNFAAVGATLISSEETRQHLLERQNGTGNMPGEYPPDPRAVPAITVKGSTVFYLDGETIEISHLPHIHTDGDLAVRFVKADVIQTGDTFFKGFYPFIDVDNGGSIDGMIAWCDTLAAQAGPNTRIIPGHGVVANRQDVIKYAAMLRKVRTRVAAAIAKGESLDQLIGARPLAAFDAEYGTGMVKEPVILSLVYKDLSRGAATH